MTVKARVALGFIAMSVIFQIWAFTMVPEAEIYMSEPSVPDLRAGGYSPEDMLELLTLYGEQGRTTYLQAQKKIDLVIPALGMGMFVMSIWALGDGLVMRGRRWSSKQALALACFGFLSPAFDYGENFLIAKAMRAGPEGLDPRLVELSSLCTQLKFGLMPIVFVLIAVLAALRWRQSRRQPMQDRG